MLPSATDVRLFLDAGQFIDALFISRLSRMFVIGGYFLPII
jgi:hypothetical protein